MYSAVTRQVSHIALICGLSLMASVGNVHAQEAANSSEADLAAQRDEQGRQLFLSGQQAFEEGRFFDALDYFQTSYQLTQRPQLLFNIGQTADRLRLDELAIESFQGYLGALPDAANRDAVHERLRILREAVERAAAESAAEDREPASDGESADDGVQEILSDTSTPPAAVEAADSRSYRWLWWTLAGVAVAAGVTAGVVLAQSNEGDLREGNVGGIVFTLGTGR